MIRKGFTLAFIFMMALAAASAQNNTLDTLKNIVQPAVPAGFNINNEQTRADRFSCQAAYDKDATGNSRLIFAFYRAAEEFSELSLNMDHQILEHNGRKILFLDGSKTGMSGLQIILPSGRFDITHRTLDGTAMNKEGLLEMLSKIAVEQLK